MFSETLRQWLSYLILCWNWIISSQPITIASCYSTTSQSTILHTRQQNIHHTLRSQTALLGSLAPYCNRKTLYWFLQCIFEADIIGNRNHLGSCRALINCGRWGVRHHGCLIDLTKEGTIIILMLLRFCHMAIWRIRSSATSIFVNQLVQTNNKEIMKASHHWYILKLVYPSTTSAFFAPMRKACYAITSLC